MTTRIGHRLLTLMLVVFAEPAWSHAEGPPPPLERIETIALKGPVGGLDHMAIDAARGRLLVANTANGSLDVVDIKANRLLQQVPGQKRIRGVDYSPVLNRVFVGNGAGGICNIFDGEDYRLIKTVPLGEDADNVRYHPKTGKLYVVHADRELAVIDVKGHALAAPIPLPESLGAFKIETARPRMYVNAKAAGLVIAIDAEACRIVGRFPVAPSGVNAALAIDEANRRLFVGCRQGPALVVMDSDTGRVIARVPIPGGVDDLGFDAGRGRVYASCGDGAIAVVRRIDADHYEALAEIPTARGARTSFLDPDSGRLYLAVPRRPERPEQLEPELWVYQARP